MGKTPARGTPASTQPCVKLEVKLCHNPRGPPTAFQAQEFLAGLDAFEILHEVQCNAEDAVRCTRDVRDTPKLPKVHQGWS